MSNRKFWLIDPYNDCCMLELHSKAPRDAALKATTRGTTQICLVDVDAGKLHIFRGERVPLADKEQTDFTRKQNITSKPTVKKMAYRNLNCAVTKSNVQTVCAELREMMQ